MTRLKSSLLHSLAVALCVGCGNERTDDDAPLFSAEELMNPEICKSCHPQHYEEWSHSMHAYASSDPVFLAMNRRGQQETAGALGDFCVRCHAPMAVRAGATLDGLNLESLPASQRGITCYFCHNADSVTGTHNNPVLLDEAAPRTLRAGIRDALPTRAHASEFSALLTASEPESSTLCGSCHDIVLPAPPAPAAVELERTFKEWQTTLFAPGQDPQNPHGVSCGGCHMPPSTRTAEGPAASGTARARKLHDHIFPGVDVALDGAFADSVDPLGSAAEGTSDELNASEVASFLNTALRVASLCVEHPVDSRDRIRLLVDLDNVGAGHGFPSGASQDRRLWVDVRVLVDGALVYSSGTVQEGEQAPPREPDLWMFGDEAKKSDGSPAHMFWDVASVTPHAMGGVVTRVVGAAGYDATHAVRAYPRAANGWLDAPFDPARLRVELRIQLLPIALDTLDDLVASGHLEASVRDRMRAHTLLPNLALARPELVARFPELARFAEVSFEWSSLTLDSPYFAPASMRVQGTSELSCVGMNRGP